EIASALHRLIRIRRSDTCGLLFSGAAAMPHGSARTSQVSRIAPIFSRSSQRWKLRRIQLQFRLTIESNGQLIFAVPQSGGGSCGVCLQASVSPEKPVHLSFFKCFGAHAHAIPV